jgi:hypothetical protein
MLNCRSLAVLAITLIVAAALLGSGRSPHGLPGLSADEEVATAIRAGQSGTNTMACTSNCTCQVVVDEASNCVTDRYHGSCTVSSYCKFCGTCSGFCFACNGSTVPSCTEAQVSPCCMLTMQCGSAWINGAYVCSCQPSTMMSGAGQKRTC